MNCNKRGIDRLINCTNKKGCLYTFLIAALVCILALLFVVPLSNTFIPEIEDDGTYIEVNSETVTTEREEITTLMETSEQEETTTIVGTSGVIVTTIIETLETEEATTFIETLGTEEATTIIETQGTEEATTIIETLGTEEVTTIIETPKTEEVTSMDSETTEIVTRRPSGEVVELSLAQYAEYRHQTTGTMWNDDSSAKCTHPELLAYCEDICDIWFTGHANMEETKKLLWGCPVKTNQDYYDLTGRWMWDQNPNNTFEVAAVNLAHAYFDGYVDFLAEGESYQQIGYKLMFEEEMAVRHFLYMKAYYDSDLDKTIIYYAAVQWKWFRE